MQFHIGFSQRVETPFNFNGCPFPSTLPIEVLITPSSHMPTSAPEPQRPCDNMFCH